MREFGNPCPVLLMTRTLGHGGTERQLAETALSLDRRRFTPFVACVDSGGFRADELRAAGIEILELPMRSLLGRDCVAAVARLRRFVREKGIRLIHAFDPPMNVFGVPVGQILGVPAVLSSQRCFEDTIWPKYRRPVAFAHRLADGAVANCQAMADYLRDFYRVPADRVRICHNGCDTDRFSPPTSRTPPHQPLIGTVCVLREEKSLATLVRAFGMLQRNRTKLAIVGDGPERPALEKLANELGLGSSCEFYNAVSNVADWLRRIDVFVLPSRSEAFSNSLLEAMSSGCCVIASRVGGNVEMVRDGFNGLLFDPGSPESLVASMRQVIDDPALRQSLAANARQEVLARYSKPASARRMGEIYLEFLARGGVQLCAE